jgi:L-aspartate oxidase
MKTHYYDFVIIGSGIAGLTFALEVSQHGTVAVITKKELMESNSNYAQGGIAAVLDKHDSFESHIEDTLKAGCQINNTNAVEIMVREAPEQIKKLINFGVGFSRENKNLSLTQEGGHSARRIAHVHDATGKEIERALMFQVRNNPNITIFESHMAIDLLQEDNTCIGTKVLHTEEKCTETFFAKTVALASGGAAQVYARNCNPKIATGDGVAMAYRAGADIQGMEFIQFHPTALALEGKPTFLISETVRGEGGILKHADETTFMEKYHEKKEMAPRDIVSRAIYTEMQHGQIYLDIRHKGSAYIKKRFPYIYEQLWWHGIKMDTQMIPVAPAAHYTCGGIQTSVDGETSILGLFAFGEVAHTGVHGANRLASNSLLECMVFGSRAAKKSITYIQNKSHKKNQSDEETSSETQEKVIHTFDPKNDAIKKKIQTLMWKHVGIIRNKTDLAETLETLNYIYNDITNIYDKGITMDVIELKNLAQIAILITKAALAREKSIGAHYLVNS